MAENVKRRVAAARLAVAFVAAGTIAGAAAWAQASPAPTTAEQSILISSHKIKLDSSNIKNGSLLFADFIKGEVASGKQFKKLETSVNSYKQTTDASISTIKGEIGDIKNQVSGIKSDLGGYIKSSDADSRYYKLTDAVVTGDGSVHTATAAVGNAAVTLLNLPGQVKVEGIPGSQIKVTNTSSGPLNHTSCNGVQTPVPAGTLQPGQSVNCNASSSFAQALQLIGSGASPSVMTLNFSSIAGQSTVQILIGL
jgi:hypothetical protein